MSNGDWVCVEWEMIPNSRAKRLLERARDAGWAKPTGPWVCGGAVVSAFLGVEPRDIDIYSPHGGLEGLEGPTSSSSYADTFEGLEVVDKVPLQVVNSEFVKRTLDGTLLGFDLAEAMMGYDGYAILASKLGLIGLATRTLHVRANHTTTASRVDKYLARGFDIEEAERAKLEPDYDWDGAE